MYSKNKTCFILAGIVIFMSSCATKTAAVKTKKEEIKLVVFESDSTGFWKDLASPSKEEHSGTIKPERYRLLSLDFMKMKQYLLTAPHENDQNNLPGLFVNLPMPEGTYQGFIVYETVVMAPELAAKFPEIKTFAGNGVVDKTMSVRLDFNPNGLHAMMLTIKGSINIDPYSTMESGRYICYYKQDFNPGVKPRFEVDSLK